MLPRALAAIALAGADAAITWEEAKCVLRGQKVTFFGDSLTRYCFFGLNNFLATGELRADEFSSKQSMGAGPGSGDYDGIESWNDEGILTDQATQRQHAWKTFSDGDFDTRPIETEFYFIQHVWWDDADDTPAEADTPIGSKGHTLADQVAGDATLADVAATLEADVVVYNMGWWQLLKSYSAYECGKGFDAECEAWYDATLARVVDELLDVDGRLGIYRTTSCCGKEIDGDIGAWVAPIEAQNRVAASLMARRGVPVVDVYPLYGLDGLDAHTFDDKHANVAMCHAYEDVRALARVAVVRRGRAPQPPRADRGRGQRRRGRRAAPRVDGAHDLGQGDAERRRQEALGREARGDLRLEGGAVDAAVDGGREHVVGEARRELDGAPPLEELELVRVGLVAVRFLVRGAEHLRDLQLADVLDEALGAEDEREVDARVPGRLPLLRLCGNQIFNPTSMCA